MPEFPRTALRGAGEGLKHILKAPLLHHGRGGTQPARAGWVRALHPAADDIEERLALFDSDGADRAFERRR
jgi:hypothetical protein